MEFSFCKVTLQSGEQISGGRQCVRRLLQAEAQARAKDGLDESSKEREVDAFQSYSEGRNNRTW